MNTPPNTARRTPFPAFRNAPPATHHFITALARVYQDAGLPFPAAFRAALADYAGFEEPEEVEPSLRAA